MVRRFLVLCALGAMSAVLLPAAFVSRLCAWLGLRRAALRLGAWVLGLWARGILFLVGVQLEVEGARPPGTFLIVSNHVSYLDIPVLAAVFPGRFVAKSEIAGWPVLGPLARVVGTLFLVQGRRRDVVRVDREMEVTLQAGISVVLFPEGGSSRGATVERLHSSLFESAVRTQIRCLAVTVHYETPDDEWSPAATVCWWGEMTFGAHAWNLLGLRRVRARVRIAPEPRTGSHRKVLAEALHADLLAQFTPIRQEPFPPADAGGALARTRAADDGVVGEESGE